MLQPWISSFQNGLTFASIQSGCRDTTRQSWPLRAFFPCFPRKCMEKCDKTLTLHFWKMFHFGSSSLLKPLFWYSSPILWVIQTLLGIFWDFDFFAHFWSGKVQKNGIFSKKVDFSTFPAPKTGQKIPSNISITHEMGLLYQKLGFKSELEPKWKHFWDKKS